MVKERDWDKKTGRPRMFWNVRPGKKAAAFFWQPCFFLAFPLNVLGSRLNDSWILKQHLFQDCVNSGNVFAFPQQRGSSTFPSTEGRREKNAVIGLAVMDLFFYTKVGWGSLV